jgi:hypothetical protein
MALSVNGKTHELSKSMGLKERTKNFFVSKLSELILKITNEKLITHLKTCRIVLNTDVNTNPVNINIKAWGQELAEKAYKKLESLSPPKSTKNYNLTSKASTQLDMESDWFLYWCNELKLAPLYHRKLWELAFCLQVLFEAGVLKNNKEAKGIGFGCGKEPIGSYLASKKIKTVITDLETKLAKNKGWVQSNEHTSHIEDAFNPKIVSKNIFSQFSKHVFVDMNNIPKNLKTQEFDFCWSICALEHLGSIENGLKFIENSLKTLKPGGIAVHTTEFNYLQDDKTISYGPTVLFLKKHFVELKKRCLKLGYEMLEPDFDVGCGVLDKYIDVPPFAGNNAIYKSNFKNYKPIQLKLSVAQYPVTCFGIIIKKKQ